VWWEGLFGSTAMLDQIEDTLNRYLSLVKQMREKEPRLVDIYQKNELDGLYYTATANILVKLNRLNRDMDKLSDMFYIVGGIKK
jgi:hypothetical protein